VGPPPRPRGGPRRPPPGPRAPRPPPRPRIGGAEAGLALEVNRGYLEVLQQEEAVRLARRELSRAEANLRLASARAAVGTATLLEERQAEVAVGRARVNLVREEGGARNARLRLFQLMGEEPDGRELRLTSTFEVDPPDEDLDELYRTSLEMNPDLAALRAQETAAGYGLRAARSAYLPSLSLQAGWAGFTRQASSNAFVLGQAERQAEAQLAQCRFQNELFSRLADPLPQEDCSQFELGPDQRDAVLSANQAFPFDFTRQPPSVSLSLSLPIFQGFQRRHQVETAQVTRDNAQLRVREQRLAVRSEIAQNLTVVESAYEAVLLEAQNREVAEQQLLLAREEFEAGMVDFLQLADAEAVRARADREYLAAVYGYHEALAALEAVVGVSLRTR
jgi:outer membrane protein